MGGNFSMQICCGTCGRCKKEEEANEETSETKPILQTSRDPSISIEKQPSTPALKTSDQGSEEVQSPCWDRQLLADAAEKSRETCSPADPMGVTEECEAAWGSVDFLVASADRETKGEVAVLTQLQSQQEREKACNTEEKTKPASHASEAQLVMHAAQDVKLVAFIGQPDEQAGAGSQGGSYAGGTLQETNILNFMEITGEMAAGQDCEIKPPTETAESPVGRNLPLHAVQEMAKEAGPCPPAEHTEEMDRDSLAEGSPQSTGSDKIMCLVETEPLLSFQVTQETRTEDSPEEIVSGMAERHSTSAMLWEALYPGGESPETEDQLLDLLQQDTQSVVLTAQEMRSLSSAESELSEVFCQASDKDQICLSDLVECEEIKECDPETLGGEAEPQEMITQPTTQLPEEPLACTQMPVKEEAEFLNVAPLHSEVFESGGEIQAENAQA
ncbi:uncharacterized protein LOC118178077 [Oxyura jamaicensis]|uniref:uncharacterized protein LOC118178077 n=1 Tax=Oxyura jamaicensis TaxID=8884 RepID=UPI0015A5AB54|nr:uncharacterized protein LOC118178077 [Oxyura jamaicensis]